jgi:hypothetical protein
VGCGVSFLEHMETGSFFNKGFEGNFDHGTGALGWIDWV